MGENIARTFDLSQTLAIDRDDPHNEDDPHDGDDRHDDHDPHHEDDPHHEHLPYDEHDSRNDSSNRERVAGRKVINTPDKPRAPVSAGASHAVVATNLADATFFVKILNARFDKKLTSL